MSEPKIKIHYDVGNIEYVTTETVLTVIVGQPLVVTDIELSGRILSAHHQSFSLDENAAKSAFFRRHPFLVYKKAPYHGLVTIEAYKEGQGILIIRDFPTDEIIAMIFLLIYNPYSR